MNTHTEILALAKKLKPELRRNFASSYYIEDEPKELRRYQHAALILHTVETVPELTRLVKTEFSAFEELINNPQYHRYQIPKKKGGFRDIYAPSQALKRAQKILNYHLQGYYLCIKPDVAHGFVVNPISYEKPCNIVSNAKVHINKKHLLNIDIKDFFPTITAKRVFELFRGEYFDFTGKIAALITLLCTYEGILPAGSPVSPVISNFICLDLDKQFVQFCDENQLNYSRYADDLSFSSDTKISIEQITAIKNIIQSNGFAVNEKKVYVCSSASRQTVTGITVNQKLNVNRQLLKKTRAMLHDLKTKSLETATQKHFNITTATTEKQRQIFIRRLAGYINFIGQVRGKDDAIYRRMKMGFDGVFEGDL